MKITFLGTGAADFSPLLETEYKNKLGLDQRRSSSILIEDQFLVDCGPHTLDSLRIQGLDASGITDLFVTHFHSDHYQHQLVQELASRTRRGRNRSRWNTGCSARWSRDRKSGRRG